MALDPEDREFIATAIAEAMNRVEPAPVADDVARTEAAAEAEVKVIEARAEADVKVIEAVAEAQHESEPEHHENRELDPLESGEADVEPIVEPPTPETDHWLFRKFGKRK